MGERDTRADDRRDEPDAGREDDAPSKKIDRGQKFHERSGEFDDVFKALAILIVIGAIVYGIYLL